MSMFDTPDRDGTVVLAEDLLAGAVEEEKHAPPAVPEVVYLPTTAPVGRGDANFVVELRQLVDNRIGLLAYSSLDSLLECCGAAQPWVAVPSGQLEYIRTQSGADVTGLDTPLPRHLTRELPVGDWR